MSSELLEVAAQHVYPTAFFLGSILMYYALLLGHRDSKNNSPKR